MHVSRNFKTKRKRRENAPLLANDNKKIILNWIKFD